MNEFKERFFTTIGSVASKTKDIAEKAVDVAKDIGGKTADKAKQFAKIAKLNVEIGAEKDTIRKAYTEIGKLYYEKHKNDCEDEFAQLCDEISLSMKTIAEKEAEIEELKNELGEECGDDDFFEVEFEEMPAEDEGEEDGCCCKDGVCSFSPPEDEPVEESENDNPEA